MTLLVLVASPVRSAQYLPWVTGLAAVRLAAGRTMRRPVALAVLCAAGLSAVIFPAGWNSLLHGSAARRPAAGQLSKNTVNSTKAMVVTARVP